MTTILTNPAKEYLAVPIEEIPTVGEEWHPVTDPWVADGYTITRDGKMRSPFGKLLRTRVESGEHLWVSIRTSAGTQGSSRLDRVMLNTFVGVRNDLMPEHADGDPANCSIDNLSWREPHPSELGGLKTSQSRRKAEAKKRARAAKADPVTVAPKAAKAKAARREIVMTRNYEFDGMKVTVSAEGALMSMEPNPNRGLSLTQTMALAEIMVRVAEMNILMGVKPVTKI